MRIDEYASGITNQVLELVNAGDIDRGLELCTQLIAELQGDSSELGVESLCLAITNLCAIHLGLGNMDLVESSADTGIARAQGRAEEGIRAQLAELLWFKAEGQWRGGGRGAGDRAIATYRMLVDEFFGGPDLDSTATGRPTAAVVADGMVKLGAQLLNQNQVTEAFRTWRKLDERYGRSTSVEVRRAVANGLFMTASNFKSMHQKEASKEFYQKIIDRFKYEQDPDVQNNVAIARSEIAWMNRRFFGLLK